MQITIKRVLSWILVFTMIIGMSGQAVYAKGNKVKGGKKPKKQQVQRIEVNENVETTTSTFQTKSFNQELKAFVKELEPEKELLILESDEEAIRILNQMVEVKTTTSTFSNHLYFESDDLDDEITNDWNINLQLL